MRPNIIKITVIIYIFVLNYFSRDLNGETCKRVNKHYFREREGGWEQGGEKRILLNTLVKNAGVLRASAIQ